MILAVEAYLKENIDENVVIKLKKVKSRVPIFLTNIYNFYDLKILDTSCILLEILDDLPGVDVIKKHVNRIEELTNQPIVLYYKAITRYRRKSLIENRISFIIEDGQIFLPFLSLDLKKISPCLERKPTTFTPSDQLLFLYFLYNQDAVVNSTEIAKIMGFTPMTASRVLNKLYDAKLVTFELGGRTGRSKEYKRILNPEYFKKGLKYIKTPVKRVFFVEEAPQNSLIAGLEALSELSMINPPEYMVRAISNKYLKEKDIKIINNMDIVKDNKFVQLEVWDYDPKLFSANKYPDLLSLYASLKDEKDERIEMALDEMLRGEVWYTD
jgi:DNA-binding transcriptional ArsR family regulator